MVENSPPEWMAQAAADFNRHENRKDGDRLSRCLAGALATLREALFLRVHRDLEQAIGRDSMFAPISEIKAREQAARETEAYELAESAAMAGQLRYVREPSTWYVSWLSGLMSRESASAVEIVDRARQYLPQITDDRRHAFMNAMGRILAESVQAPLVLFRLFPLAVQIATASAFGDRAMARALRSEQYRILPAITDCGQCRGEVLECGEQCRACGNPLWKYQWLIAAD